MTFMYAWNGRGKKAWDPWLSIFFALMCHKKRVNITLKFLKGKLTNKQENIYTFQKQLL